MFPDSGGLSGFSKIPKVACQVHAQGILEVGEYQAQGLTEGNGTTFKGSKRRKDERRELGREGEMMRKYIRFSTGIVTKRKLRATIGGCQSHALGINENRHSCLSYTDLFLYYS